MWLQPNTREKTMHIKKQKQALRPLIYQSARSYDQGELVVHLVNFINVRIAHVSLNNLSHNSLSARAQCINQFFFQEVEDYRINCFRGSGCFVIDEA